MYTHVYNAYLYSMPISQKLRKDKKSNLTRNYLIIDI